MKPEELLEKMKPNRKREPYKWLVPAFEWLIQDAKHCLENVGILADEISLMERAINKSEDLVQFWEMPQMVWYCASYLRRTHDHRMNCITLVEVSREEARMKSGGNATAFIRACDSLLKRSKEARDKLSEESERSKKTEKLLVRSRKLIEEPLLKATQSSKIKPNENFLGDDLPF